MEQGNTKNTGARLGNPTLDPAAPVRLHETYVSSGEQCASFLWLTVFCPEFCVRSRLAGKKGQGLPRSANTKRRLEEVESSLWELHVQKDTSDRQVGRCTPLEVRMRRRGIGQPIEREQGTADSNKYSEGQGTQGTCCSEI